MYYEHEDFHSACAGKGGLILRQDYPPTISPNYPCGTVFVPFACCIFHLPCPGGSLWICLTEPRAQSAELLLAEEQDGKQDGDGRLGEGRNEPLLPWFRLITGGISSMGSHRPKIQP